ncbi:MAG TPA: hypothetical protein VJ813_06590 [Vicinamibacterales bacterium]|nr:hypothetical protein [Vicinamibacterales bacterium]
MILSDMLGRDLRIEWHEAVALMRDLVDRGPEIEKGRVPELHQVELLPWGQVEVHGGSGVSDPVQRLCQMCQALLTRADPPVQLRLVIAQPPESVRAFSEALAFFERPERVSILQALYNRASAAVPLTDPSEFADTVIAASPVIPEQKREAPATPPGRRKWLVYATGGLALIAALGGAALARRAESGSRIAEATEMTAKVSKSVTGAVTSAVSAIGERVGLSSAAAAPAPEPPVEAPKPSTPISKLRTKSPGGAPSRADAELQRAALSAFDLDAAKDLVTEPEPMDVPAPASERATPRTETPDVTVYTLNSPGVSAPVGVRPQLPQELPPGVRREDLTRIELLILPDGTVESVKLLDPPKTVHDWMLLSAAKAWEFHPARKGGVPVRYRKTVWVAH